MLVDESVPRIGQRLLEPEADPAFLRIDIEHHDPDLLTGRDDLAWVHILFGPAHLGNMNQPLDPRLQLDKGAVVGDVGNPAPELRSGRVFQLDTFPRVGFELLHAERDALGLGVEANNLHLDGLPDIQRFRGVVDAPPGDVGHVQQSIHPAQIDKSAVVGDVLDHTIEDLAFLEAGNQFRALLGAALLKYGAARDHDVAARAVHFEDLEGLRRSKQRADVTHRPNVDLAARQKRNSAAKVDGEAALNSPEDYSRYSVVCLKALLKLGPGLLAPRLLARQLGLAVLVLHPLEVDLDGVADMKVGLVAPGGELLQRHAAFRFEADIDEHGVVFDRNDPALDDRAFQTVDHAQGFVEKRGEILLRRRPPHLQFYRH